MSKQILYFLKCLQGPTRKQVLYFLKCLQGLTKKQILYFLKCLREPIRKKNTVRVAIKSCKQTRDHRRASKIQLILYSLRCWFTINIKFLQNNEIPHRSEYYINFLCIYFYKNKYIFNKKNCCFLRLTHSTTDGRLITGFEFWLEIFAVGRCTYEFLKVM